MSDPEFVAMTARVRQIDSLTPLRGIAAVLVVLYHLVAISGFMQLGNPFAGSGFISRGYLWVDFFFVLSGFIITHVYGARFTDQSRAAAVREYIRARFARIYPLHFFALTLTVLVYIGLFSKMPAPEGGNSSMAQIYEWKALPFHYLLLIGFGLTPLGWNVPAWSIATEWWTYLLAVPLFRFLNRGVSRLTFIVPALCVAGLFTLIKLHPTHTLNITFDFGLIRCLLSFTIGICLYQLYRNQTGVGRLASDAALAVAASATCLVLQFPVPPPMPSNPAEIPDPGFWTPIADALSPLVFAGLILCAAYNRSVGHRLLNAKPLRYLGDISYSIYLMQGQAFMVVFIVGGVWRSKNPTGTMSVPMALGLYGATLLFNIVLAALTYRWVELPARTWLRGKKRS